MFDCMIIMAASLCAPPPQSFPTFFVVFRHCRRCRRHHRLFHAVRPSIRPFTRLWGNYPTNPASWLFHNRATLQYTCSRFTVAPTNLRFSTPSLEALLYCAFAGWWRLVTWHCFLRSVLLLFCSGTNSQPVKQSFGGCHFTTYNDSCLPIYAPSSFIVITLSGAYAPLYPGNLVL